MADTNSKGGRWYHLYFWLISASEEHQRRATDKQKRRNKENNKRTTSGCQTWLQLSLLQHLWHYLSTLTCSVSWIQKWNIMSDKLSHYSPVRNRRTTFISGVMTTNCCTESMWHDAQFLVSCMADLIVSAENSLGVSWLEILAGESLQSSDNLHIPFQRSIWNPLTETEGTKSLWFPRGVMILVHLIILYSRESHIKYSSFYD